MFIFFCIFDVEVEIVRVCFGVIVYFFIFGKLFGNFDLFFVLFCVSESGISVYVICCVCEYSDGNFYYNDCDDIYFFYDISCLFIVLSWIFCVG